MESWFGTLPVLPLWLKVVGGVCGYFFVAAFTSWLKWALLDRKKGRVIDGVFGLFWPLWVGSAAISYNVLSTIPWEFWLGSGLFFIGFAGYASLFVSEKPISANSKGEVTG